MLRPLSVRIRAVPSHAVVAAALPGLFAFLVYARGACRTIYVGDSGELVAAAATLGIPHPSGYPLYVLLGHVWIGLLPFGSVAFRMSLASAAAAATAVSLLFHVARRTGAGGLAAAVGALTLAFSPSFWSQANVQRVYTLNALFVVALLGLALEWVRQRDGRWLTAAALVAGLGACCHTFVGVLGLVVGGWALALEPSLLRQGRALLRTSLAGLLGLSPYLYLPLRSRQDPPLDWGDPETPARLWAVVTRRDFWDRAWLESPADLVPIAADWLRGLGVELAWVGLGLLLLGLWAARRHRALLALLLATAFANLATLALHGSRSDLFLWHRYAIPSYVVAALLVALGAQALATGRGRRLVPLAALLPGLLLGLGWSRFDRSLYAIGEDYNRQLLAALPPGARLLASDDNVLFGLLYLQLVEGLRPDVDVILQGVGDAELPELRFDPDESPLYFTHHPNWQVEGLAVVPIGLVYRTLRPGSPLPTPVWPRPELAGERDPRVPKDYLTENLIGQLHFQLGVTWEARDWRRAVTELERAAAAAWRNDTLFYNLGLVYGRNGLLDRALVAYRRCHEINPRRLASDKPARAADRIAELELERRRLAIVETRLSRRDPPIPQPPGSAAEHRRLADLLERAGEPIAARGHRLLALELERPASGS